MKTSFEQVTNNLDEQISDLVQYAYTHSPYMRQRLDSVSIRPEDVQNHTDLYKIPVLPKDHIIHIQQENPPFGGMLTVPLAQVKHIFQSPGPIYEPDVGDYMAFMIEIMKYALQSVGFQAGDVVLNSMSYHLVPAGLILDQALTEMGCIVLPAGVGNRQLQIKMMEDLGVTAYVGTPSYLMSLIKDIEKSGKSWQNFLLRKALVSGEPLSPNLHTILINDYDVVVGNAYATAELGILALSKTVGMVMPLLPAPIIQIVDPDTGLEVSPGAIGEIVVTNFNKAYPLIRFGTGDLAVNVDPKPGRSIQEDRSVILVGRVGEAVKVRGMFVHPNQLTFAMKDIPEVESIQGVVTRPENRDRFTVNVTLVNQRKSSEILEISIRDAIRNICRVSLDRVNFVDAIPIDDPKIQDRRSWKFVEVT